ncbi:MAG TPA: hypothetical protein VGF67_16195 [Ktedonobacteraceae bacterium]|jgi:hypothetical protein
MAVLLLLHSVLYQNLQRRKQGTMAQADPCCDRQILVSLVPGDNRDPAYSSEAHRYLVYGELR